jgi:hypothetical protein
VNKDSHNSDKHLTRLFLLLTFPLLTPLLHSFTLPEGTTILFALLILRIAMSTLTNDVAQNTEMAPPKATSQRLDFWKQILAEPSGSFALSAVSYEQMSFSDQNWICDRFL